MSHVLDKMREAIKEWKPIGKTYIPGYVGNRIARHLSHAIDLLAAAERRAEDAERESAETNRQIDRWHEVADCERASHAESKRAFSGALKTATEVERQLRARNAELERRLVEMRKLVERAYREGHDDGIAGVYCWHESHSRAALAGEGEAGTTCMKHAMHGSCFSEGEKLADYCPACKKRVEGRKWT